ncbi:MAG: MerR family transcriptional regulator [Acidobacteriota bacterium]|nr:MAG: MerR family transcriptional regulator [Acidobacteriota bacterium]
MEELVEKTGFDRRTIAFYVQEGLLPRIGRRGPRTRYPKLFADRLALIKRLRELQDAGKAGSVTLREIGEIFESVPAAVIAQIAAGTRPLASILPGEADESDSVMARAIEFAAAPESEHVLFESHMLAASPVAPDEDREAGPAPEASARGGFLRARLSRLRAAMPAPAGETSSAESDRDQLRELRTRLSKLQRSYHEQRETLAQLTEVAGSLERSIEATAAEIERLAEVVERLVNES